MIRIGDVVISKAGHDEGRLYVVLNHREADFVLLVDGRFRKLDNPKSKRIKHTRFIAECPEICRLLQEGSLTDAHVVFQLKQVAASKNASQET